MADEGDSFRVVAIAAWTSSESTSLEKPGWVGVDSPLELEDEALAMDRTTSPLQIGHVRRRVVSHGVLEYLVFVWSKGESARLTCTPHGTHGRMGGS